MLKNKSKWIAAAAVAVIAGLPTLGMARAHYTGTLPSSVMMAAATTPVRTSTAVHHKLSGVSRRARVATVSHKKTVKAVKHKKGKKHHKKSKKA
jgi:hypothetical protein